MAIQTLHQLAEDCESYHSFASEILRKKMYVDDILAGSHSFVEATRNRDDIIHVLLFENGLQLIDVVAAAHSGLKNTISLC